MAKHSKDLQDEVAILNELLALEAEKDIRAFIKGEERESVLDAAQERINELLKPKQGEQAGPITRDTRDFKGPGVEKTKASESVTISDIIKPIDEADEKRARDIERADAEAKAAAAKAKEEAAGPRTYVTGEDVIKKMRAEGKKI